jgi:hypothetical protein
MRSLIAVIALAAAATSTACTTYRDPCDNVGCAAGFVCLALESGATCVCDSDHEIPDGGCASAEGEGEGE